MMHGAHGDGRVHMVGCTHAGNVQVLVLAVQHAPPILVQAGAGVFLFHGIAHGGIDIGHANKRDFRMSRDAIESGEGHIARSETGESEGAVAWRRDEAGNESRRSQECAAADAELAHSESIIVADLPSSRYH